MVTVWCTVHSKLVYMKLGFEVFEEKKKFKCMQQQKYAQKQHKNAEGPLTSHRKLVTFLLSNSEKYSSYITHLGCYIVTNHSLQWNAEQSPLGASGSERVKGFPLYTKQMPHVMCWSVLLCCVAHLMIKSSTSKYHGDGIGPLRLVFPFLGGVVPQV